jgi:hypothetical protein
LNYSAPRRKRKSRMCSTRPFSSAVTMTRSATTIGKPAILKAKKKN